MATEFPDGNPDAFEEGTQIPVVQQILFQEGSATKKKKLTAPRPLYPGDSFKFPIRGAREIRISIIIQHLNNFAIHFELHSISYLQIHL